MTGNRGTRRGTLQGRPSRSLAIMEAPSSALLRPAPSPLWGEGLAGDGVSPHMGRAWSICCTFAGIERKKSSGRRRKWAGAAKVWGNCRKRREAVSSFAGKCKFSLGGLDRSASIEYDRSRITTKSGPAGMVRRGPEEDCHAAEFFRGDSSCLPQREHQAQAHHALGASAQAGYSSLDHVYGRRSGSGGRTGSAGIIMSSIQGRTGAP